MEGDRISPPTNRLLLVPLARLTRSMQRRTEGFNHQSILITSFRPTTHTLRTRFREVVHILKRNLKSLILWYRSSFSAGMTQRKPNPTSRIFGRRSQLDKLNSALIVPLFHYGIQPL